jgi:hypothetical protein
LELSILISKFLMSDLEISSLPPFVKGPGGCPPLAGVRGWFYITKNPSKSPFIKGRLNEIKMFHV